MRKFFAAFLVLPFALVVRGEVAGGADSVPAIPASGAAPATDAAAPPADLAAALERLKMPGVKINLAEWSVDVAATLCLRDGLLELIACTVDSKEHESIIAVEARPSHIHTALLLLGATPGNPAMVRVIESEEPGQAPRYAHFPPAGHPVGVFLVIDDGGPQEHPISDFIVLASDGDEDDEGDEDERFPADPFLFTGSILADAGEGPRRYLADESGHVISIATFGDELLALPGVHSHSNEGLMWRINDAKLPELGAKVTLRLRPQREPSPAAETQSIPRSK